MNNWVQIKNTALTIKIWGWTDLNVHIMRIETYETMTQTLLCFKIMCFKFCIWTPWNEKIKVGESK